MRIVNLGKLEKDQGARVAATVIWEDRDAPNQEIYFECRGPAAADLAPNPDAFLLGCVMPAMEYGERRVMVEGEVCSELRHGLETAFAVITNWYPDQRAPALEASAGFRPRLPRTPPRVASFLSGGIDALATLRGNRLDYPLDHPASIRDGIYIFGLNSNDFVGNEPVRERVADFDRRRARMESFAEAAGIDLIAVYTNVRFIFRDFHSWWMQGMGAGLSAVAHTLSSRISRALIGSAGVKGPVRPLGTHPLLDPNYSDSALQIKQDGLWLSRFEKTAMVAEWESALAVLQCCQRHQIPATINCGRCNKCTRTMIHLAALGALERTSVFPTRVITPEMISDAEVTHSFDAEFLEQAAKLLDARGLSDLAQAVRERVGRFREIDRKRRRREALAAWDRRLTGGC